MATESFASALGGDYIPVGYATSMDNLDQDTMGRIQAKVDAITDDITARGVIVLAKDKEWIGCNAYLDAVVTPRHDAVVIMQKGVIRRALLDDRASVRIEDSEHFARYDGPPNRGAELLAEVLYFHGCRSVHFGEVKAQI